MCEQELGYHHCPVGLDFVTGKVQVLKGGALLQSLCDHLGACTLQSVSLDVQGTETSEFGSTGKFDIYKDLKPQAKNHPFTYYRRT